MRNRSEFSFTLAATALAVSAMLAACGGGGDASGPADLTPPTVTISDNVDGTASGPVTFTFTFSEAVSGFTVDDVSVTNGTKGALVMASDNMSAALVITPAASSTGTIEVNVAAGAFADTSGNGSTAAATASQAFDTTTPVTPVSGATGTCTAAPCINFSEATVGLVDFGLLGVEVTADPVDATNKVAKLTKESTDETWAGATVHLGSGDFTVARIDTTQNISLRVYSPAAGKTIMVKIEGPGATAQEVQVTSTKAAEWETLNFDFSGASSSAVYNKISVFPGFGTALNEVYYIDELKYVQATAATFPSTLPITYDNSSLTYVFTGFGGADDSGIAVDPTNSNNKVGRATKSDTAELWAGTTISTGITFPFNNSQQTMSLRVYSPRAGIPVRLKVEDASDVNKYVETEATVTQANGWQTLIFNFANQAAGTPAINLSNTYNKASVFFDFGTTGALGGGGTFYFDDLNMGN